MFNTEEEWRFVIVARMLADSMADLIRCTKDDLVRRIAERGGTAEAAARLPAGLLRLRLATQLAELSTAPTDVLTEAWESRYKERVPARPSPHDGNNRTGGVRFGTLEAWRSAVRNHLIATTLFDLIAASREGMLAHLRTKVASPEQVEELAPAPTDAIREGMARGMSEMISTMTDDELDHLWRAKFSDPPPGKPGHE